MIPHGKPQQRYTIDGVDYDVGCLLTTASLRLYLRLTQLGTAPLVALIGKPVTQNGDAAALMVQGFADAARPEDIDAVVKPLLSQVVAQIDGQPVPMERVFDTYFAGRLDHLLAVLKVSAAHNGYGSFTIAFLNELVDWFGKARSKPAVDKASKPKS